MSVTPDQLETVEQGMSMLTDAMHRASNGHGPHIKEVQPIDFAPPHVRGDSAAAVALTAAYEASALMHEQQADELEARLMKIANAHRDLAHQIRQSGIKRAQEVQLHADLVAEHQHLIEQSSALLARH